MVKKIIIEIITEDDDADTREVAECIKDSVDGVVEINAMKESGLIGLYHRGDRLA